MRTEIPMPIAISADDAVESDATETSVKTPSANADTNLRMERFILLPSFGPEHFRPKHLTQAGTRHHYVPAI